MLRAAIVGCGAMSEDWLRAICDMDAPRDTVANQSFTDFDASVVHARAVQFDRRVSSALPSSWRSHPWPSRSPEGHAGVIADFVRVVADEGRPLTSGIGNVHNLAMVLAAIESVETKHRVTIKEPETLAA